MLGRSTKTFMALLASTVAFLFVYTALAFYTRGTPETWECEGVQTFASGTSTPGQLYLEAVEYSPLEFWVAEVSAGTVAVKGQVIAVLGYTETDDSLRFNDPFVGRGSDERGSLSKTSMEFSLSDKRGRYTWQGVCSAEPYSTAEGA